MTKDFHHTALAAVFRGPGERMSLEEVCLPDLAEGEVLVRVRACTLCGSDLHTYAGDRGTPVPTILGHEILGEIVDLGKGKVPTDFNGRPLAIGERITWSVAASCGDCFFCDREIPQKCEHLFKYGHEEMKPPHALSGGLAEFCHLAAGTAIVRIPDSLPDRVACPVNCATATVAAALRVGMTRTGIDAVLVHGVGMLGLTACAMLRSRGVGVVVAVDQDAARLTLAKEFGATDTVEVGAGDEALSDTIAEVAGGRGVDLALEMSGAPAAVTQGLAALRIGGRQVLVGSVFPTDPVSIYPEAMIRGLLSVHGVHNYTPRDLAEAVDFLEKHHREFPFSSLVQGSYALREVEMAFAEAIRSRPPRVLVEMQR